MSGSIGSVESGSEDRFARRRRLHEGHRRAQLWRAALVGMFAGAAGVGFQLAVARAEGLAHWLATHAHWIVVVLATALMGGLAAWLTGKFAPEAGGSGIPHIKAVLLHLRLLRPNRVITVKLIGGLLALAAGMSLGREGPTVQIGSAVAQIVGDVFKIPRRAYSALIAAGAGAGLAAAFNAPLAGFLFVMEEMKREMSPITYGTALISSVCSVAVTRYLLGQQPQFHLPAPGPAPLVALPAIAVLGVLAGLAGVAFNKSIRLCLDWRTRLKIPLWLAGAAVGLLSGVLLLNFPLVSGGGHGPVASLLTGTLSTTHMFWLALAVFAGKLVFTALSYGTGVPGGIFAPQLVMGAFLGYAFGILVHRATPGIGFSPAGFATIGMASVLTGSVRAPLTGVVLIVEMTAEYQLLYALLVGAFAAYATAEILGDAPIYEALLERDLDQLDSSSREGAEAESLEFVVEPDSDMDGRRIRDLEMPEGALLVAVTRQGKLLVPRGATVLRSGDMVTAVVDGDDAFVGQKLHLLSRSPL